MKAIVLQKSRDIESLILTETIMPEYGSDEVLVKIAATSINAADYRSIKMGIVPKNRIYGADISGEVVAKGNNVTGLNTGDFVVADLASFGFGGFAEYVTAKEVAFVKKPEKVSFADAAATPMAGVTAYQAIKRYTTDLKNKRVLIVGASGGVGSFAVQLAKLFGANVAGVCSTNNIGLVKSLGADTVYDYTKKELHKTIDSFDIVLAIQGNNSIQFYKKLLNQNGMCVIVGGNLSQVFKGLLMGPLYSLGSKKCIALAAKPNREDLAYILQLISDGKLRPVIERIVQLQDIPAMVKYMSTGHAKGKIVMKNDICLGSRSKCNGEAAR